MLTGTGERKFVLENPKTKIKSEDDEELTDDENIFENANMKKLKNKLSLWGYVNTNSAMLEEVQEIKKAENP